jgi:hypothetical protein
MPIYLIIAPTTAVQFMSLKATDLQLRGGLP